MIKNYYNMLDSLLRSISLLIATGIMATVWFYPYFFSKIEGIKHFYATLLFFGVCCLFIYGFGFKPESKVNQFLFGPYFAYGLTIIGFLLLVK